MKQLLVIFISVFLLASCNDNSGNNMASDNDKKDSSRAEKEESREDRNKRIVKEAVAAFNDHNVDKFVSYMTPNVVDYGDGSGDADKSSDSLAAHLRQMLNAFPDFKGENLRYFADDDQVVVVGNWSGTFKKDIGKRKATGKSFKIHDADIFTLNNEGKITEHRYVQPSETIWKQLAAGDKKK
jgi:predicted ester cyclase